MPDHIGFNTQHVSAQTHKHTLFFIFYSFVQPNPDSNPYLNPNVPNPNLNSYFASKSKVFTLKYNDKDVRKSEDRPKSLPPKNNRSRFYLQLSQFATVRNFLLVQGAKPDACYRTLTNFNEPQCLNVAKDSWEQWKTSFPPWKAFGALLCFAFIEKMLIDCDRFATIAAATLVKQSISLYLYSTFHTQKQQHNVPHTKTITSHTHKEGENK